MKQLIAIVITFLIGHPLFAQDNLVSKQYRSIKEVEGDLDKDGLAEKAVVYNMPGNEDEGAGIDRELVIFKKEGAAWVIWQRSVNAVGNSKDGGMMGDPFEGIEIKNGLLLIRQSGGSSWKWSHTDKYRFQNGSFELIGYTGSYGRPCEYWEHVDFNVLTGNIIFSKEYETCDAADKQEVYKRENEHFLYKLQQKITLKDRNKAEVKIITPLYKHELNL